METDSLILIIDDDSRNIFALNLVLKSKGYKCVTALSVAEGKDQLAKHPETNVILMDMMLPDMDGYEAIKLIGSDDRYKNLPIIAVTAQAMPGDREKCIDAGAWDYITKPVDIDKLIISIEKVLST